MPYEPNEPGRHAAHDYDKWHSGPLCEVAIVSGPTALWVYCVNCKVAAQLDTVSEKVMTGTTHAPRSTP